jgi:hypothetical protein
MNLLEEREKRIEEITTITKKIKDNYLESRNLYSLLRVLKEKEETLKKKKQELLNTNNSQVLFLIGSIFSGQMSTASEYWDLYYYDFTNDTTIIKRRFEGCRKPYEEAFDVIDYFKKDYENYIKEFLKTYVLKLIEETNPTSWEELHSVIERSIKEDDFANFLEQYRLEEKIKKLKK